MQASIHTRWLNRSRRARLLAVAALVSGVLVAGCGGSSPSPAAATASGASTPASTVATGNGTVNSSSTAPGAYGSGPLAFAKCMRASGVPNFPDPNTGRGPVFNMAGIDAASPAFEAAQAKCQKLVPGGPVGGPLSLGATTHPSPQTLAKLLKIARCMRQHGVPQFPDPQTSIPSNPSGVREITNFDGAILLFPATMNMQAPAYKQALTACGAPPLGLPH